MSTIRLTRCTLNYRRGGVAKPGTPPLLLLHASPGDHRDFDAVFDELAKTHDVIAPDWPGYGASTPLPTPASAMAFHETLIEFLDALAINRASFIGNSVGGYAAVRLAIEQPSRVEKLVLVSPGGFTPHNFFTRFFCRWQGGHYAIPPGVLARCYLRGKTPVADAMRERASHEQSAPLSRAQVASIWRSFIEPDHDLRSLATNVTCPVQLVYGRWDPVIPFWSDGRAARRAIPQAEFFVLPCGHAPFAEVPGQFIAVAAPFLAR